MRFLVDAQLPPSLASLVGSRGHWAGHVSIILSPSASDKSIVDYAISNGAIIITKDADFLTLAPPPQLILVVTGNIPNQAQLALFQERFASLIELLMEGRSVVEIG